MGGLVVDINNIHNTLERATITPNGVLFLASLGHFFDVPRESIEDKSKANALAKLLVCLQVLWIAGQATERHVAQYPISLLEVHTLVHIIFTLTMYLLWMRKPFEVQDPTLVPAADFQEALAFTVAGRKWREQSGFVARRKLKGGEG